MSTLSVDQIRLTDHDFWRHADRDEAFATLRRERPVSWHDFSPNSPEAGMKGFWAVTRYDDIVRVSSDSKTFISGDGTIIADQTVQDARDEGWFLNMDGTEHFKLRQIVSKAFSPTMVASLKDTAKRYACELVAAVKEKGECDFAVEVAQPYPVQVIGDYLGAPREDRKHLHALTVTALGGDVPELGGAPAIIAAFAELNAYGEQLARERRRLPKDDVLSLIVAAEIDGRKLTDREAGHFFQLLLTAGMETTGTVGGQMMRAFLKHPDQMRIWANDPAGVAPAGVEELVRWTTPVMQMRRTATVDTEVGGQAIRAGEKVVMWYYSGNRDESRFADASALDVRRVSNPHIAFGGGGRHTCLGAHLARLELPVLANEVVANLKDIEQTGEAKLIPSWFVNGLASLPIRFRPA